MKLNDSEVVFTCKCGEKNIFPISDKRIRIALEEKVASAMLPSCAKCGSIKTISSKMKEESVKDFFLICLIKKIHEIKG